MFRAHSDARIVRSRPSCRTVRQHGHVTGGLLVRPLRLVHALQQVELSSVEEGQASSSRTSEAVSEEVVSAPLPSMTASKSARLDSFSAITFSSIVSFATRR